MKLSDQRSGTLSETAQRALDGVFTKQLNLSIVPALPLAQTLGADEQILHATVSIQGEKISGSVLLQVSESFASMVTELLLGIQGESEEIKDVTGELCNMISGLIKAELTTAGLSGALGTPTVTTGSPITLRQNAQSELCVTDWSSGGHPVNLQILIRLLPA
jgi:CheY-specific phosphatase CheX